MPVKRFRKGTYDSYFKRKMRRGKYSRGRKTSFNRRVKKAVLNTSETKYIIGSVENLDLYHDRGDPIAGVLQTTQGAVMFNTWNLITKGTNANQRVGDEIYPRGMALRIAYYCVADRQAQYVRIIVATVPRVNTYPGSGGQIVSNAGTYDLMDPQGSNDTVTGFIKSGDSGIKVLYDRVWTGTARGKTEDIDETGDNRFFKKIFIKAKRGSKLTWQTDGFLKNNPIGVWIVPYDDYNSLRSSICGRVSFTYKLYYKDP